MADLDERLQKLVGEKASYYSSKPVDFEGKQGSYFIFSHTFSIPYSSPKKGDTSIINIDHKIYYVVEVREGMAFCLGYNLHDSLCNRAKIDLATGSTPSTGWPIGDFFVEVYFSKGKTDWDEYRRIAFKSRFELIHPGSFRFGMPIEDIISKYDTDIPGIEPVARDIEGDEYFSEKETQDRIRLQEEHGEKPVASWALNVFAKAMAEEEIMIPHHVRALKALKSFFDSRDIPYRRSERVKKAVDEFIERLKADGHEIYISNNKGYLMKPFEKG